MDAHFAQPPVVHVRELGAVLEIDPHLRELGRPHVAGERDPLIYRHVLAFDQKGAGLQSITTRAR